MPVVRSLPNRMKTIANGQNRTVAPLQAPAKATKAKGQHSRYYYEELAFQKDVIKVANQRGWQHFHVEDSRGCVPGWPDLVLVRFPRLLFVELKSSKGRLAPAQRWWLDELGAVGAEIALWTGDALPERRPGVETYVWFAGITKWDHIYDVLGV